MLRIKTFRVIVNEVFGKEGGPAFAIQELGCKLFSRPSVANNVINNKPWLTMSFYVVFYNPK